jgi:transposase-like protein
MKVREGGRVVKVAVMVATGVNADGYREILPRKRGPPGIHVATTESAAGWLSFLRDLVARGLTSHGPVALVTSDRTPAWSTRSARRCPARPGNDAGRITQPT